MHGQLILINLEPETNTKIDQSLKLQYHRIAADKMESSMSSILHVRLGRSLLYQTPIPVLARDMSLIFDWQRIVD